MLLVYFVPDQTEFKARRSPNESMSWDDCGAALSGMPIPSDLIHFSWPTLRGPPPSSANTSHFSVLAEIGWRAEFLPADHSLSDFEFDVIIGADGRRNTLEGEDCSSWS